MSYTLCDNDPACDATNNDLSTLIDISHDANVPISYAVTRCAHGYTRNETCNDCENGYSTDGHQYANLRSEPAYAVFGDDGTYCAYISKRHHVKLAKAGY